MKNTSLSTDYEGEQWARAGGDIWNEMRWIPPKRLPELPSIIKDQVNSALNPELLSMVQCNNHNIQLLSFLKAHVVMEHQRGGSCQNSSTQWEEISSPHWRCLDNALGTHLQRTAKPNVWDHRKHALQKLSILPCMILRPAEHEASPYSFTAKQRYKSESPAVILFILKRRTQ